MLHTQTKSLDPKAARRLDQLDKKLNLLLEELKDYSDDQLNRKLSPEEWSVIQVMHHLLLAESGSQQYLEKKLSFNPELQSLSISARMRKLALWFFMKAPFKWKAPKAIGDENLPSYVRFWDEAKQWKEQRISLRNYLSTLPAGIMQKEAYKHPRAGKMDIPGMLSFFEWHFDRHHKQIRNIVKHYSKQI